VDHRPHPIARSCRGKSRSGAFTNNFPLELSKGGENVKGGGTGVYFRACRYLHETIIALHEPLPLTVISNIWQRFTALSTIGPLDKPPNTA